VDRPEPKISAEDKNQDYLTLGEMNQPQGDENQAAHKQAIS
jgi:hypothetical protein